MPHLPWLPRLVSQGLSPKQICDDIPKTNDEISKDVSETGHSEQKDPNEVVPSISALIIIALNGVTKRQKEAERH